ncbi:MAG: SGNH/GDSL hydrolase family protein [Phycisphaerae bacterium]|nr:SGNH/GDSL hydrolase family protein [Phycisphaerae bacterium]
MDRHLVAVVIGAVFCMQARTGDVPQKTGAGPAGNHDLTRSIAVVGASVSAGYGLPAESSTTLAEVVGAYVGHRVQDFSTAAMFLDPAGCRVRQLGQVADAAPALVIGADFLFWDAYGDAQGEGETNLTLLDSALNELDMLLKRFGKRAPTFLLGDIPDVGPQSGLDRRFIPTKETLRLANDRIREFAETHPRVQIIPVARVYAVAQSPTGRLSIGGHTWEGSQLSELFLPDALHLSREGLIVIGFLSLQQLIEDDLIREDQVLASLEELRAKLSCFSPPHTNRVPEKRGFRLSPE